MNIMSWFKKKPQRYCEDCRWYKESVTKRPEEAWCSNYYASNYAKISRYHTSGTDCAFARNIGHCGKDAKHFESNGKQAALSDI